MPTKFFVQCKLYTIKCQDFLKADSKRKLCKSNNFCQLKIKMQHNSRAAY